MAGRFGVVSAALLPHAAAGERGGEGQDTQCFFIFFVMSGWFGVGMPVRAYE